MRFVLTGLKITTLLVFGSVMALTIGVYLNLPLPLKPLVVKTGSMEPAIDAGSLVLVTKRDPNEIGINYVEGDVITFKSGSELVSHRVVQVDRSGEQKVFVTQGDANNTADAKPVLENEIVGRVSFSIPSIGKFVSFVKTPIGFLSLIVIPTLLIIFSELLAMWEEIRKKKESKGSGLDFAKPFAMFFIAAIFLNSSHAFFTDVDTSTNNVFTAAAVFPGAAGSVVINEIMWMGSQGNAADEWIELRNMTSSPINISGWKVVNLATGVGGTVTIPASKVIPANGYFLISNDNNAGSILNFEPDVVTSSVSLLDPGEQLTLTTSTNAVIDTANGVGAWCAGENGTGQNPEKSMERNLTPSDGTVCTNWHDATTQVNIDPGRELGTPGGANSL